MMTVVYMAHPAAKSRNAWTPRGTSEMVGFLRRHADGHHAVECVRTWTPRVFHAAEYVRTRRYACRLHAFSTRTPRVDSTRFPVFVFSRHRTLRTYARWWAFSIFRQWASKKFSEKWGRKVTRRGKQYGQGTLGKKQNRN